MDRPSVLEEGHHVDPLRAPLVPHRSNLPNYLYIFSFAPPVPPISRPREFFDHPIVLYTIGTIAAAASGVGLPAFDIVTGVWTDGITADNASYSAITGAGSQAGWIMTLVGVVFFATFGIFLYCCKHLFFRPEIPVTDWQSRLLLPRCPTCSESNICLPLLSRIRPSLIVLVLEKS